MDKSNIHKLVSLTFDEDPKVRMNAATSLSSSEDPAALFALMELSYDKDIAVKDFAQKLLQEKKSSEREYMSFAEIFSMPQSADSGSVDEKSILTLKERVLSPITQLFEKKLGKERAAAVKQKMMPTIEKIYMRSKERKTDDNGKQAIQEFLTSYMEAISDLDVVKGVEIEHHPTSQKADLREKPGRKRMELPDVESVSDDGLEVVGHATHSEISKVASELKDIDSMGFDAEEEKEEDKLKSMPDSMFKKAYEVMMFSGGDEKIMQDEMRRMLANTERDLKMAFGLAKKRFKEINVTHLTELKDGMRNVSTDLLTIKSLEKLEFIEKKAKKEFTKVTVSDDEGSEGLLYVFDDRSIWLKSGMKIKIVGGIVKTFKTGETGLALGKKGNIYIVL
ncbi:MAG: hypothetical protein ABII22_01585 [Candidatus Micrarchaeota archaeon]